MACTTKHPSRSMLQCRKPTCGATATAALGAAITATTLVQSSFFTIAGLRRAAHDARTPTATERRVLEAVCIPRRRGHHARPDRPTP